MAKYKVGDVIRYKEFDTNLLVLITDNSNWAKDGQPDYDGPLYNCRILFDYNYNVCAGNEISLWLNPTERYRGMVVQKVYNFQDDLDNLINNDN